MKLINANVTLGNSVLVISEGDFIRDCHFQKVDKTIPVVRILKGADIERCIFGENIKVDVSEFLSNTDII